MVVDADLVFLSLIYLMEIIRLPLRSIVKQGNLDKEFENAFNVL